MLGFAALSANLRCDAMRCDQLHWIALRCDGVRRICGFVDWWIRGFVDWRFRGSHRGKLFLRQTPLVLKRWPLRRGERGVALDAGFLGKYLPSKHPLR
jgi:hypothetical protein